MMTTDTAIRERSANLAQMIEAKLGVKGKGLEAKLTAARRRMPGWVRREAMQLVEAEKLLAHPKLMRQADSSALDQAYRACETWLKTVDPGERRRAFWRSILATNAFNMILVALALLITLRLTEHL